MCPSITYDRFEGGLDLRKGPEVSDANRLRELTNMYVTSGKALRRRPGTRKRFELPADTVGLFTYNGRLQTFSAAYEDSTADYTVNRLRHPDGVQALVDVPFAAPFQGFLYVVGVYADGSIWHHYLDGQSPSYIDAAPHSRVVTIAASKIWAADGDVVRFSATLNPRDWATADDAGFLPTGSQRGGEQEATALGVFQKYLAVFFGDGLQLWTVDPDPDLHALFSQVDSTGTTYPRSVRSVFSDLYYLADSGFKSVAIQGFNQSEEETDIGSPIDDLVEPLLAAGPAEPIAGFYAARGQYWAALGATVYVYTFSRSAKISAWSEYRFPWAIADMTELGSTLFLRADDGSVYEVDEHAARDDAQAVTWLVRMAYLDMKQPGNLKRVHGVDVVARGGGTLAFGFDPRREEVLASPLRFDGNTRPGPMLGVEICSTSVSPQLSGEGDEIFQLDALTLNYDVLPAR